MRPDHPHSGISDTSFYGFCHFVPKEELCICKNELIQELFLTYFNAVAPQTVVYHYISELFHHKFGVILVKKVLVAFCSQSNELCILNAA